MALLKSYTFLTKKTVFYSVTVGANTKKEAKEIASDPNYKHYCEQEDDVVWLEQDKYQVVKLIEEN
tara:strand:+ start:150 stop:347 length:198 start_codon:yes stop_codon:yes gene_type:complete